MYTTFQVSEKMGIPRSTLQAYLDRKLITSSIHRAKGKGSKSVFSKDDLYRLRLFLDLARFGISLDEASSLNKQVHFEVAEKKSFRYVLIAPDSDKKDGAMVILHAGRGLVKVELMEKHRTSIVLNLAKIIRDVDKLME